MSEFKPDYNRIWLETVRRFKEESGEDGADLTRIFQTHDAWVRLYNDEHDLSRKSLVLAKIAKSYAGMMELHRGAVGQWESCYDRLAELRETWLAELRETDGLSDVEKEMLNVIPLDIERPIRRRLTVSLANEWRATLLKIMDAHLEGVRSLTIKIVKEILAVQRAMREVESFARETVILQMLAGKIVVLGYPEHLDSSEELTPEEREDVGRLGRTLGGRPLGSYTATPTLEEAKGLILKMLEEGEPYLDDRGPNQAAIVAGLLEETPCADSTAYRRVKEVLAMPDVVARFQK